MTGREGQRENTEREKENRKRKEGRTAEKEELKGESTIKEAKRK